MSHPDSTAPAPFSQIPDYSGYRFHHDGTLTTRWLSGSGRPWVKAEEWHVVVRPANPALGYTATSFRSDSGGTTYDYVHIMCALAFHGPCPKGLEVCHRDDVKANNAIGNIYYGTRAQNIADAFRNGHRPVGEKNSKAKLTEMQVTEILDRGHVRGSQTAMAREFGVSITTVNSIMRGRNWKHMPRNREG